MTTFARYFIYLLLIIGCTSQTSYQDNAEIPKAFQADGKYSLSDVKGRYNSYDRDIVKELWQEHLKENTALKDQIEQFLTINDACTDQFKSFNEFNSNNINFYLYANREALAIKDSIIESDMKLLLSKSQDQYDKQIQPFLDRKVIVAGLKDEISDQIIRIKLQATLKMTEEYQNQTKLLFEQLDKEIEALKAIKMKFKEAI